MVSSSNIRGADRCPLSIGYVYIQLGMSAANASDLSGAVEYGCIKKFSKKFRLKKSREFSDKKLGLKCQ